MRHRILAPWLVWIPLVLSAQESDVRQAPRRIAPSAHGIGRRIPNLAGVDLGGKSIVLADLAPGRPVVLALLSSSCPISQKFGPELGRFEKQYRPKGISFLYIAPVPADSDADLRGYALRNGLEGAVVRDREGSLASRLGALSTTEVFLLDAARTLVYRGALSDQYGAGYSLDEARTNYLADAIAALEAGKPPRIPATSAPGCTLDLSGAKARPGPVTYHDRISRIVQKSCLECHRQGGVAPFSLETRADLAAHKGMIRTVVRQGTMPPWFAAPSREGEPSPWANDRSLSKDEKEDLLGWMDAGLPEGDPKDAPLARRFPEGWTLGTPDAVFRIPHPVQVKAEGTMPYVDLEVDTHFPEDRWVSALEVRPTAREVVHHVLVFASKGEKPGETPEEGFRRRLSEFGGFFAVYVPGLSTLIYPEGYAKPLPKGSKLRFQLHYTPNGTARQDRTELGLLFSKTPPRKVVRTIGISNVFLQIPPGAERYEAQGTIPVLFDVEVLSFFPHMHLRGKAFQYEANLPGGKREILLDVPRYDFNWQLSYFLAEPRVLPKGTWVNVKGWFDNSAKNPANPDPTRNVRWGPQTTDEMLLGYVDYVNLSEHPKAGDR